MPPKQQAWAAGVVDFGTYRSSVNPMNAPAHSFTRTNATQVEPDVGNIYLGSQSEK